MKFKYNWHFTDKGLLQQHLVSSLADNGKADKQVKENCPGKINVGITEISKKKKKKKKKKRDQKHIYLPYSTTRTSRSFVATLPENIHYYQNNKENKSLSNYHDTLS